MYSIQRIKIHPFCKLLFNAFWKIISHRAKSFRQEIRVKASFLPIPFTFWANMDGYLIYLDFSLVPKMSCQSYFRGLWKSDNIMHKRWVYIVKFLQQIPYWTLPLRGNRAISIYSELLILHPQTFLSVLISVIGTTNRNPDVILESLLSLKNHIQLIKNAY